MSVGRLSCGEMSLALCVQGVETVAHLQGCWADTPVKPGDCVNLIAEGYTHQGTRHAVVNDDSGLLILHPDVLLSGGRGDIRIRRL